MIVIINVSCITQDYKGNGRRQITIHDAEFPYQTANAVRKLISTMVSSAFIEAQKDKELKEREENIVKSTESNKETSDGT